MKNGIRFVTAMTAAAFAVCTTPVSAHAASEAGTARSRLTGDWGGSRTMLEERGVDIGAHIVQVTQGVLDGGIDSEWKYGGRANVTLNLDTDKMGLWPGGFFTLELEGSWTESANPSTGALLPVNNNHLYPAPGGDTFGVPNVSFLQFLSPYAGIVVGKLDTTTGDANLFAHGKGDDQFLNLAFGINPVALVVPYSTLGVGAVVLPTKDPEKAIVTVTLSSATGDATRTGFDDIDGAIVAAEGRLRTEFGGLTGHQLVGGLYSSKSYTSIDQRLDAVVGNQELRTTADTWAVYANVDQFLYQPDKDAMRGVGVFGRFGAGEGNPNPIRYFFSVGLAAIGMVPGRADDHGGIGYYYSDNDSPTLAGPRRQRSFLGNEWGVELYYNIAVTPWLRLTPDLQFVNPARKRVTVDPRNTDRIDTATVLGFRLEMIL